MAARLPVEIIYGPALLKDTAEAAEIFDQVLPKYGITMLDTARIYPGGEETIAKAGGNKNFRLTTKVQYGKHKREEILQSAKESFEILQVDKVEVYLLHSPDHSTLIEETMDAIQELYLQGRFEKFGLSNFKTDEVVSCYEYAKSKGYVLPSVYQGHYNVLYRGDEERLFPTLRSLGFSIQAYSPLAAGFLMKTPEDIQQAAEKLKGTRWDPESRLGGNYYLKIYNKPSLLEFLGNFNQLAEESGAGRLGLATRWIKYHSVLDGAHGDALILGSRSKEDLEVNLAEAEKGPLDAWVVEKLEEMWKGVREDVSGDTTAGSLSTHEIKALGRSIERV